MPNHDAYVAQLIRRGIMPSTAERIVAECETNGQSLGTPAEAAMAADVTEADKERARLWWYYSPDVPQRLRRILDARTVGDA